MKETGKRIVAALVCVMLMVCLLPVNAHADTGPKPSVEVTLENLDGRECYGTLLSKTDQVPLAGVWDGNENNRDLSYNLDEDIWRAFVDYKDADGFYYLQHAWRCDETGSFSWDYHPPETFKILLYFPGTGEFAVSGILERYAFDSYFTADLTDGTMAVRRSYNYTQDIAGFIARVMMTILIELGVALLFGLRERNLLVLITGVNLVTQAALNVVLRAIYNAEGPWAVLIFYIPLELAVFIVEAVVYCLTFHRFTERMIGKGKIVLYALAANVCSFVIGWVISRFIPAMF